MSDKSSVQLAREACSTEQGKLALYYLAGRLSDLPSYCLIAPNDNGISREQVHKLIEDLQRGKP
jgi:hypothetical protein